jgi:hypothetical protein
VRRMMAAVPIFLALSCGGAEHFGAPFTGAASATIADLTGKPEDHLRQERRVSGVIVRQCPATGCWFFLKDPEGRELKVELSGTLRKLPPRVGRTAEVEGRLIRYGEGLEFVGGSVEFK